MKYHFAGEARECEDYYGVLVATEDSKEIEVGFRRDGEIFVQPLDCGAGVLSDREQIIAAAKDPQVVEQLELFMAGLPCCDLTNM